MATDLKKTDVVIVGLGAAGGVAALPLARAGLDVIGIEAGDLALAARFRARRAAQQFPRLAAIGAEGEQRDPDPSAQRVGALFAAPSHPSDDERGRRHLAALLGAELAAQSVGLQGGERDHAPLRRRAHSQGLDGRGLAVRARGARALLRQGRIRGRRFRPGRQYRRHDRPARQHLRGPARARLSDAAAARHRVHRADGDDRAQARLASVPRPGGDQLADLRRPPGLPLSRLLQPRRLPRQRQELDRGEHHPQGARDRAAQRGDAGDRHPHRRRRKERPRAAASPISRAARNISSPPTWCCSPATPTRTCACCCCRSRSRSPTGSPTTAARSAGIT